MLSVPLFVVIPLTQMELQKVKGSGQRWTESAANSISLLSLNTTPSSIFFNVEHQIYCMFFWPLRYNVDDCKKTSTLAAKFHTIAFTK